MFPIALRHVVDAPVVPVLLECEAQGQPGVDKRSMGVQGDPCMAQFVGPVQDLKDKMMNRYRVRMVLDNMPITTFDLTTVRPCLCFLHPGNRRSSLCTGIY